MKQPTKAIMYAAIAVISWSTVATAFKIALREVSYYEMLLIASPVATFVFAIAVTVRKQWSAVTQLSGKQWISFALTGLLNPFIYYLILFKAYDLLPAQIAQPINCMWPVVLLVMLAVMNRQKIPKFKYLGMFISLVGMFLISSGFTGSSFRYGEISVPGLALAFFSAFLWALFWVVNRMNSATDSTVALFISFLFGTVYLVAGIPFADVHLSVNQGVVASIYVGIFEMGIPFTFFGLALRKTNNPTLINQLCFLFPFISLIFIHFILGENIQASTVTGLFLIVSGIIFNEYNFFKHTPS